MTKVVVTGALGFLGRALTACLADSGLTVVGLSRRMSSGMATQIASYMDAPASDVLVHLAEEPDRGKVNGAGESYLLEAEALARQLSQTTSRMIYASSGTVYGDENEEACDVDMPVVASDIYNRSKLRNEAIVLAAGGSVARLSNLFGPGMSPNNVISDIARQVPGHGELRVRDDTPIRDFLHVSDAARALALLVTGTVPGIFNVGSGRGTSIREVAQLALRSAGEEYRDIIATQPSKLRSVNILDVSRTRDLLGWSAPAPDAQLTRFFRSGAAF